MPLTYGGGISSIDNAKAVFDCGVEKFQLTQHLLKIWSNFEIAKIYGEQAVVCSIDVKKVYLAHILFTKSQNVLSYNKNPVTWAKALEKSGAGEILLTSVDREGSWLGYDTELIRLVNENTAIPVIAHGGAG